MNDYRPNKCALITAGILVAFAAAACAAAPTNAPAPPSPWDASATLGLTLTRGNSKTLLFTGNFQAAKKWPHNELNLGLDGVYGENKDVKNAEAIRGFGQINHLFSERGFGYMRVEAFHDGIANIDYRITVSPGGGYYLLKSTNTTLRAEVGPGYIYEQDGEATVGTTVVPSHSKSYISLRIAERFDHKVNDRVKIWQTAEYLPEVDKFSNYIINAELGVETSMTKHLSQQTLIQDTYHSEPAPGRQKNDVKLIAAFKYKF